MPRVRSAPVARRNVQSKRCLFIMLGNACALRLFWAPIQFSPPIEKDENRWSIVAEAAAGRKLSFAYFSAKASSLNLNDFPLPLGERRLLQWRADKKTNSQQHLLLFHCLSYADRIDSLIVQLDLSLKCVWYMNGINSGVQVVQPGRVKSRPELWNARGNE